MADDKPIRPGRGGDKRWTAENHPVGVPYAAGNPGRPKGSRHKLGEAFLTAMAKDFAESGIATIEKVRLEDPSTYVRVIAGLLPKEVTGADGEPLLAGIQVSFVRPNSGS